MAINENKQHLLRNLPGVDHILETVKKQPDYSNVPKRVLVSSIRRAIEDIRNEIIEAVPDTSEKNKQKMC